MKPHPRLLALAGCVLGLAAVPTPAPARAALPAWLESAAATQAANSPREADAVVLHDESVNSVAPDGKVTSTARWAVRVLKRSGCKHAVMAASYSTDSEKVLSVRAWLVRPSGEVKNYSMRDAIDVAASPEALYAEARRIEISAASEAEVGGVFGYEVSREDRSVHSQSVWVFQSQLPVVQSRTTWHLPKGWSIAGTTFNHAPVAPSITDAGTTWELRDLPAYAKEPLGPSESRTAAQLAVDLRPPSAGGARAPRRTFSSWADVSAYVVELHEPQVTPDAAIKAKTNAVLGTAGPSLWERIQAIARFAQSVNYVSIQMGLGRGGGYRPHAAAEVLRCNYGDCKGKTALMRAMLQAAGIPSFSVIAYWGDRSRIREEWPSPQQFNHCIVAVRTDASVTAPAVVEHPQLGRLLVFDPTDSTTPPGDLNTDHQGSLVLVAAADGGGLVRLPFLPPEDSRLDRSIVARLDVRGGLSGTIVEKSSGQVAARERYVFRTAKASEYTHAIEQWMSSSLGGVRLARVEPADDFSSGNFSLGVDFSVERYAKSTLATLLVVKPALVSRRDATPLTAAKRTLPVLLEPRAFSEKTEIALPPGFRVDETGKPVEVVTSFGSYSARCTSGDGLLLFERSLVIKAAEVPPEDYAEVRRFFDAI